MPASDYSLFEEFEDFGGNDSDYTRGHFVDWLDLYRESGSSQDDPDDDREMFYQFMNAFMPDTQYHSRDWWRDIRESYYDLSGITEEDIDWEAWRQAFDS